MTIRDDFETVLTSGAFYSADSSPEMEERQVALRSITQRIVSHWSPLSGR
jgi:hypothetical protein